MEVRVKRCSTTSDTSIISHSAKKNHKYIARVKGKNGKYRYFYDREEYQEYLNGKKSSDGILDKVGDWFGKLNKRRVGFQKKAERKVNEIIDKYKNRSSKDTLIDKRAIKKAKKFVDDLFDKKISDKISDKISEKKKPKYIAKVKLPNGKHRYFYKQSEYDAYLKRLDYQKDEPGFMGKIKKISKNKVFTAKEDMSKVNEKFDPYDDDTSTNCTNCSAAYELRRRGYDVEAKPKDKTYNARQDRVYDYFEDAEYIGVYSDGSTIKHNEKYVRKLQDGKATWLDRAKNRDDHKFYTEDQSYTSKSIEKAIKSNNPPGSRGFIDVEWKAGSAHSIVYEVDNKGKVTIRDSQTNDEYSLEELAPKVKKVRIARTDNLKLKKGILGAVTENKDKDREYYVDKGQLHRKS